jgi:hypothetical protein
MKEMNKYGKWQSFVVVLFGLLITATMYILFCPIGGLYSGTMTLWEYYTNDLYQLLTAFSGSDFLDALTWRRIMIWPCVIGDIACMYAYVKLNKKIEENGKE